MYFHFKSKDFDFHRFSKNIFTSCFLHTIYREWLIEWTLESQLKKTTNGTENIGIKEKENSSNDASQNGNN